MVVNPRTRLARFILLAAAAGSIAFAGHASAASSAIAAVAEQKQITPNYSIAVSKNNPQKGDVIEATVQAEGLNDAYAFEISLAYDASLLKWLDAKTDVPGFSVKPIVEGGQVKLAHTLVGKVDGLSGSRELFKVRFEVIGLGDSKIILREMRIVDSKLASKRRKSGLQRNSPPPRTLWFSRI